MINKRIENNIKIIINKLDTYEIKDIELMPSSQNKVYKVTTDKNILVVKEFSLDAIKNYYYLKKRKEQIRISEILNKNNIKTISPLTINNKKFIYLKKHYYIVYDYTTSKPLNRKELTLEHIKILATTQSKIHKLKINTKLTCFYHRIKIDLKKQLSKVKNIDEELYNLIKDNYDSLTDLINTCNNNISNIKENLCVSHNDYKLLNILWNNKEMYLIDFDATGLSNPTVSLCESAYTFSKVNNKIDHNYYKEYLKSYINDYGTLKDSFKEALYVAMNGKLQFLNYMFSKNTKKKDNYIEETKGMIKSLVLYYNNINTFNEMYNELKKGDY